MSVATLPRGTADAVLRRVFAPDYRNDPVGYCRDILGFEPWSKQRAILEAVRDHRRVAVRSAHGIGKTAIAARAALWFLAAHPGDTRVVTTGASWEGVRDLLWKELHQAHPASGLGGKLSETRLDLGGKRFAVGLSTDRPERFHGHHADHLLLIVDEASGLDERIFEAASGYLTKDTARLLLIGNPTQLAGEFHAAFHSKRDSYETINVSAFDTPAFTGEDTPAAASVDLRKWVDEMRALYGEDSPVWQVRVLGEFPSTADNTVCSLSAVEAAQKRDVFPGRRTVVSCDVARFGSDETVIAVRRGDRVRIAAVYSGQNLMRTVGEVIRVARDVYQRVQEQPVIVVDDAGVGGGVTDRLNEIRGGDEGFREFRVVAFNGGSTDRRFVNVDEYPNLRSQAWFTLASRLGELDLPDDEKLVADLVAPRYTIDPRGRRVVESKDDTKKRLGRSPDRADALLMAFALPDHAVSAVPGPTATLSDELAGLGWGGHSSLDGALDSLARAGGNR